MTQQPNETPHDWTGTADPGDGDRHGAFAGRDGATTDISAGRPSPVGTGISTAVAARVTGRWTGAQFEALLEHVEDCAVFVLDEDGRVQTWNDRAEAVTGYTSEEAIGSHVSLLYPEAVAESDGPERDLRIAAEEGGLESEGWRVRADGSAFRAETTIRPLRENGERTGFVNVTRDVTDERHERPRCDRCERLEDLITAAAHDLRGPLTVAAGEARLAAETGDRSNVDAVTRALDRAEELVDSLATLAEKGERVREADPVDLREVATAAWKVTETDRATLSIAGEAAFPADRCRTQQLLENLFNNAVEHGVPEGDGSDDGDDETAVNVRVGSLPDRSGFYVEDDGPGIPARDREQVFESGYSTAEDGTGFGLAIVRTIAEAHDWSVDVVEGEAGGARFEVRTDAD
jgi:PAS domain S-box-containing protein